MRRRVTDLLADSGLSGRPELRERDLESVLVDAITTIRAAIAIALIGDDPFTLNESTVDISFAVTGEGTISLGAEGTLANELTHTLTVGLVPAQQDASGP